MPLTLLPHSPQVEAIAAARLAELRSQPWQALGLFGAEHERALGEVVLAAPHTGHTLDAGALQAGGEIAAAKPFARRYLLLEGREAIGSLDIAPPDEEVELSVPRLGAGPHDPALLAALREARELLAGDPATVEPRFLTCPGIDFVALWLHGPGERVMPLLPAQEDLVDRKVYGAGEIEPILAQLIAENRQLGDQS